MRVYECALVLKPTLSPQARKKMLEEIKKALKDAKISKEDEWGEKALSYPISKQTSGFYSLLTIEAEEGIPSLFEKKLFDNENVLRHLLIRRK